MVNLGGTWWDSPKFPQHGGSQHGGSLTLDMALTLTHISVRGHFCFDLAPGVHGGAALLGGLKIPERPKAKPRATHRVGQHSRQFAVCTPMPRRVVDN